jgi:hypothetical protein
MKEDQKPYQEFFKEEVYDGFTKFLLSKFSSATCIALLDDEPLFTKKGVHVQFRKTFNEFLNKNPHVEKVFANNSGKCFVLKNVAGEMLHFPIDAKDNELMVREGIRIPVVLPTMDRKDVPRAYKLIKNTAEPMKKQVLKGDWSESRFIIPKNLTIHFKRGYALSIGHTTETYKVESKDQINNLIFDVFENKVAFAIFEKQRLSFVRNGNQIKTKIVHSPVQQ